MLPPVRGEAILDTNNINGIFPLRLVMSSETRVGLAILGGQNQAKHLSAFKKVSDIRLVGVSLEGANAPRLPEGVRTFPHYSEALNNPEVQGLVLCTPLSERDYWIEKGARAGKHILCSVPLAPTCKRAREIVECCRGAGVCLSVFADVIVAPLKAAISRIAKKGEIGSVLFFDLKVSLPKQWLINEREGVLLLYGLPFIYLSQILGEIDSIYARTRSLGLNRPTEDVVVAQLKFKHGLEGIFQLNGLGDKEEAVVNLYGSDGVVEVRLDQLEVSEGFECYYEDFIRVVRYGKKPVWEGVDVVSSHYFLEWIQQSARLDREILRKDARIQ